MNKIIFLPKWYQDALSKKKVARLKTYVMVLAAINFILIFALGKNCLHLKEIEEKKQEIIASEVEAKKSKVSFSRDFGALKTMNCFISDFSGKISFTNVTPEDKKISFETIIEDKNKYYDIVKLLEEKKKYKILSISKVEEKSQGIKLKVSLEVVI